MRLLGVAAVLATMNRIKGSGAGAASDALNKAAQDVYAESQRRVPVDLGNLKASARIEPSTPDELRASISYGGTAAQYAAIVHETHRSQSKFLESPAREYEAQLRDGVAKAVKDRL